MKIINFLSMGALALTLVGCGGSGNGDSGSGGSVSGQVADGYLLGAKVCFDTNDTKTCADESEVAISGNMGEYTLASKDAPIIAEVTTDTTDLDTNTKVTNAYVLSAPKGKTFISPITTMIQGRIESNPSLDANFAALLLKSEIGMEGSKDALYANYVAKKDDDKVYKTLYLTAQIVARAQGELRMQFIKRIETVGGITGDTKKLLKQAVDVEMIKLSKDFFTTAKTFVDSHTDTTVAQMVAQADIKYNAIKSDLTQAVNIAFKDQATIEAKQGNANRDKSGDTLQTAENFIKGKSNGFVFASPLQEKNIITWWTGDKYYTYEFRDVADFKTNWLTLEEATVIAKIKGDNTSVQTLKVKSGGLIEFDDSGNAIQVSRIGKESIAGITLTCSEMVDLNDKAGLCNSTDGIHKDKTVLFAAGDERYHFSFIQYSRFNKSNVVDKLKTMDFNELCPTIGNDSNYSYCHENNGLYDSYLSPTASQRIYYDTHNKVSYFWASDASSSNRKVEACSYGTSPNTCKTGSVKTAIGIVIEAELKNSEKVFIVPRLADGTVKYEIRLKHTANGETKEYRVRSNVSISDEPHVGTYSPFNWSAYKKIFTIFNP
ncbi:MAG: hypothetical protein FE834_03830 [Gammaproteobacteria bacterium]|nr:hypothetical protein [Gammaproteobacteria bacterium]